MNNSNELTLDNVRSVYSGKVNTCACGCAGKHRYNSRFVEEASKDRGYAVTPDEVVKDSAINRVIKIIQDNANNISMVEKSFISVDVGKRMYIAYLTDAAQEK